MELPHLSTIEDHTTDMSSIMIVPIEKGTSMKYFLYLYIKNETGLVEVRIQGTVEEKR